MAAPEHATWHDDVSMMSPGRVSLLTSAVGQVNVNCCLVNMSVGVTPGLQKDINRAIIYVPGSSHTYIQQNEQYITAHIT